MSDEDSYSLRSENSEDSTGDALRDSLSAAGGSIPSVNRYGTADDDDSHADFNKEYTMEQIRKLADTSRRELESEKRVREVTRARSDYTKLWREMKMIVLGIEGSFKKIDDTLETILEAERCVKEPMEIRRKVEALKSYFVDMNRHWKAIPEQLPDVVSQQEESLLETSQLIGRINETEQDIEDNYVQFKDKGNQVATHIKHFRNQLENQWTQRSKSALRVVKRQLNITVLKMKERLLRQSSFFVKLALQKWKMDQFYKAEGLLHTRLQKILACSDEPEKAKNTANEVLNNIRSIRNRYIIEKEASSFKSELIRKYLPSLWDLFKIVKDIGEYILDVYSDVFLAMTFWSQWSGNNRLYAIFTFAFVLLPTVTATFRGDIRKMLDCYPTPTTVVKWIRWFFAYGLQLAPVVGHWYQLQGCLRSYIAMKKRKIITASVTWVRFKSEVDSVLWLCFIETAFEAAPQLALQIAIILNEGTASATFESWVSIFTSFLRLSKQVAIWSRWFDDQAMWKGRIFRTALKMLWHSSMMVPRLMAISCIGSVAPGSLICGVVLHAVLIAAIAYTRNKSPTHTLNKLMESLMYGLMNTFIHEVLSGRNIIGITSLTAPWFALYWVYVVENVTAITVWVLLVDGPHTSHWYFTTILAAVLSLIPLGFFAVILNKTCFKETDECKDADCKKIVTHDLKRTFNLLQPQQEPESPA